MGKHSQTRQGRFRTSTKAVKINAAQEVDLESDDIAAAVATLNIPRAGHPNEQTTDQSEGQHCVAAVAAFQNLTESNIVKSFNNVLEKGDFRSELANYLAQQGVDIQQASVLASTVKVLPKAYPREAYDCYLEVQQENVKLYYGIGVQWRMPIQPKTAHKSKRTQPDKRRQHTPLFYVQQAVTKGQQFAFLFSGSAVFGATGGEIAEYVENNDGVLDGFEVSEDDSEDLLVFNELEVVEEEGKDGEIVASVVCEAPDAKTTCFEGKFDVGENGMQLEPFNNLKDFLRWMLLMVAQGKVVPLKPTEDDRNAGLPPPHTFTRHEDRLSASKLEAAAGIIRRIAPQGFEVETCNVECAGRSSLLLIAPHDYVAEKLNTIQDALKLSGRSESAATAIVSSLATVLDFLAMYRPSQAVTQFAASLRESKEEVSLQDVTSNIYRCLDAVKDMWPQAEDFRASKKAKKDVATDVETDDEEEGERELVFGSADIDTSETNILHPGLRRLDEFEATPTILQLHYRPELLERTKLVRVVSLERSGRLQLSDLIRGEKRSISSVRNFLKVEGSSLLIVVTEENIPCQLQEAYLLSPASLKFLFPGLLNGSSYAYADVASLLKNHDISVQPLDNKKLFTEVTDATTTDILRATVISGRLPALMSIAFPVLLHSCGMSVSSAGITLGSSENPKSWLIKLVDQLISKVDPEHKDKLEASLKVLLEDDVRVITGDGIEGRIVSYRKALETTGVELGNARADGGNLVLSTYAALGSGDLELGKKRFDAMNEWEAALRQVGAGPTDEVAFVADSRRGEHAYCVEWKQRVLEVFSHAAVKTAFDNAEAAGLTLMQLYNRWTKRSRVDIYGEGRWTGQATAEVKQVAEKMRQEKKLATSAKRLAMAKSGGGDNEYGKKLAKALNDFEAALREVEVGPMAGLKLTLAVKRTEEELQRWKRWIFKAFPSETATIDSAFKEAEAAGLDLATLYHRWHAGFDRSRDPWVGSLSDDKVSQLQEELKKESNAMRIEARAKNSTGKKRKK